MKKENQQKKKNKQLNSYSEFASLNNELGSFGLEPPKIYRGEQKNKVTSRKFTTENKKIRKQNQDKKNNLKGKASGNFNNEFNISSREKIITQNKKRKQKRFIRKILGTLGIVLGIIIVVVVMNFVFFNIDTINVSGSTVYEEQEILNALPISYGDNLFISNLKEAQEELESTLPYVYNAEIQRDFPTGINVVITEPKTIFRVKNNDDTYLLLDSDLKVLDSKSSVKPENSVIIKKINIDTAYEGMNVVLKKEQQQKDLLQLTRLVDELDLDDKITAVYSESIGSNYAVYDNRIIIKFGTTEDLEDKMYSALTVIEEKLEKSNPNAKGVLTATGDKQIYFTEE